MRPLTHICFYINSKGSLCLNKYTWLKHCRLDLSITHPKFLDPKQTQHYAFSHVELLAYIVLDGLKLNSAFYTQYPHVLYKQDEWNTQYKLFQRKLQDRNAQALVKLCEDIQSKKLSSLDEFYSRFNVLLNPKRGKALKAQKRRNAGMLGAIESAGDEAVNNRELFKAIYRYAVSVSHTGATTATLDMALSDIIKEHHNHPLSNSQRNALFKRLQQKIVEMEQQVSEIEARLLKSRIKGKADKVAFNAYTLYSVIKLHAAVGDTVGMSQEGWAASVPFGEKAIQPALDLLVKLKVLEVIEKAKATSFAGKATIYKRLV